jgi:hypothetical protein
MSIARHHAEWLSLLEISGPFLSLETLAAVFPQGIEQDNPQVRRHLRQAYEEWLDNQGGVRAAGAIHEAWVFYVLTRVLELPETQLKRGAALPLAWQVKLEEHGETLVPDLAVVDPLDGRPRLLVQVVPPQQKLESDLGGKPWKATPAARMQTLLYGVDAPLGLVTNGEQWMLVYAPRNATAGYVSWYASLWLEEPLTLRAWISLLGAHRLYLAPEESTLAAMLRRSADDQAEVTDQLGYQVRRAVELLVHAIDVADRDAGAALLAEVSEAELYEAAITVMMRLVFLFCAEERELFPLADELYSTYYAATPMRGQLRAAADEYGEEVIERRTDAWHRLLATTRAIYGGIQHADLRLPAYGSDLFDPDRFPFLEGRRPLTSWTNTAAQPLPINNRTVLHLLEALQLLQVRGPGGETQKRRLSFRALDVEQIGHVYEGLLDHQAVRATEPILGLGGTKDREPEVPLRELTSKLASGGAAGASLLDYLKEQTGRSAAALQKALASIPDSGWQGKLLAACGGDEALYAAVLPFGGLIRADDLGQPLVILPGSVYVTAGANRRSTGAHYTPRVLTEPIVQHTLEPLVYTGPAEGRPREQWKLRPPGELIALKICDMAMGSGAFLVQVCRYLGERLLEALEQEEHAQRKRAHKAGEAIFAPLREAVEAEERTILARRLVAERCVYGVDKNHLAVDMAKLSLWLITMDKGRAFSFLDHALKCGDSLVGIHSLDQLRTWSLEGTGERQFSTLEVDLIIERMIQKRQEMEDMPVRDIEDQQLKGYMLAEAEAITHDLKASADMLIASYYNTLKKGPQETLRQALLLASRDGADVEEKWREHADLGDLRPFHWPLEFPETFLSQGRSGFDAFVGNPPFIGGQRIRGAVGGAYLDYLKTRWNHTRGSADLCAYFFLRAFELLAANGSLGLLATNTIAQGDTRAVGLDHIINHGGSIFAATSNQTWPGQAAVVVSIVHIRRGMYLANRSLNGRSVARISPMLDSSEEASPPFQLAANKDLSFQGSNVLGIGFTLTAEKANSLIKSDPKNAAVLFPYLNGEDLNSHPQQQPSRWIINFHDWPMERSATGCWAYSDEQQRRSFLRVGLVPADYPGPVAADYPDCLAIVRNDVYPERARNRDRQRREIWWRFTRPAIELYKRISPLHRVLALTIVSRTVAFVFVPKNQVYAHKLAVFALESGYHFAVLQSSLHHHWAWKYSSTLKQDLNYSPTDVFQTFPFPRLTSESEALLNHIGNNYHDLRQDIMCSSQQGLTEIYKRFHDETDLSFQLVQLRQLQAQIDYAVTAAYGWTDIELDHGFHEAAQASRYTVSEPARREMLRRLLELNHERYAEEVKAGAHDQPRDKDKIRGSAADEEQMAFL